MSLIGSPLLAPGVRQTIYLLHLPFNLPFLNKVKAQKPKMAKDSLLGPSDWSLAGHLMPHQGERGSSRVPARAVRNLQPLNEVGSQQWSGRMKSCWCWQRKQHSNRSGRNPGQSPFPGISVSLPSNLSLTSHTYLDSIRIELRVPRKQEELFGH